MTDELQPQHLGVALIGFLKTVASLVAALAVIGSALWMGASPYVNAYIEEKLIPIEVAVARLERAVPTQKAVPIIEFQGSGLLVSQGPFHPGDVVEIAFSLRRNDPCPTTVQVQFIAAKTGRVDSSLTTEGPATRADVTRGFSTFVVGVRLPEHIPDGRYSYAARLIPECSEFEEVTAPPSEFFEVVNGT